MKKLLLVLAVAFAAASCTENQRVKRFGGNATIDLTAGQGLEMVTWKGDQLWVLTTNRPDSVTAKSYTFSEKSSWGVFQGNYTITEH